MLVSDAAGCTLRPALPCQDDAEVVNDSDIGRIIFTKQGVLHHSQVLQMLRENQGALLDLQTCIVLPRTCNPITEGHDDQVKQCKKKILRPFEEASQTLQLLVPARPTLSQYAFADLHNVTLERVIETENLVLGIEIMNQRSYLQVDVQLDNLVHVPSQDRKFLSSWKWSGIDNAQHLGNNSDALQAFVDSRIEQQTEYQFDPPELYFASSFFGKNEWILNLAKQTYVTGIQTLIQAVMDNSKAGTDLNPNQIAFMTSVLSTLKAQADKAAETSRPSRVPITKQWMVTYNTFSTGCMLLHYLIRLCARPEEAAGDFTVSRCALDILRDVIAPMTAFSPTQRANHKRLICKFKNILDTYLKGRNAHRWRTCISAQVGSPLSPSPPDERGYEGGVDYDDYQPPETPEPPDTLDDSFDLSLLELLPEAPNIAATPKSFVGAVPPIIPFVPLTASPSKSANPSRGFVETVLSPAKSVVQTLSVLEPVAHSPVKSVVPTLSVSAPVAPSPVKSVRKVSSVLAPVVSSPVKSVRKASSVLEPVVSAPVQSVERPVSVLAPVAPSPVQSVERPVSVLAPVVSVPFVAAPPPPVASLVPKRVVKAKFDTSKMFDDF